jgi:transforming growth factor-beta-induced protein
MKRLFLKFAAVTVLGAVVSACGGSDDDNNEPTRNIVQAAESAGLTSLLAAATKAELVTALSASSTAGLTVFAPTNAAFNTLATQLGLADGPALVAALPKEALASILSYHVLPARKSAADLSSGGATQATIYTFDGSAATVRVNTTGGVNIGDAVLTEAKVTSADVAATNGVVHVVDKVLVPPGVLNVVQMAQANPGAFSSLVGAVVSADLATTLSGTGPFTVFAPTNTAFAAAPAGLTTEQLTTVLTYHVLGSQVLSTAIPFGTPVTTVAGQDITINAGTAPVIATITDTTATPATITAVDVRASNGVIHVIDKVLIPSLTDPT